MGTSNEHGYMKKTCKQAQGPYYKNKNKQI